MSVTGEAEQQASGGDDARGEMVLLCFSVVWGEGGNMMGLEEAGGATALHRPGLAFGRVWLGLNFFIYFLLLI